MRSSSLSILANKKFVDKNSSTFNKRDTKISSLIQIKDTNRRTSLGRTVTQMSQSNNNHQNLHHRSKSYNLNQNRQTFQLRNKTKRSQREILLSSTTKHNKNLKNFIKNQQSSESYVRESNYLKKTSFLFNNRLTKSVFDISDAAMIGKPQGLKEFKSARGNYQKSQRDGFGMLKTAVRKITGKKQLQQQTDINKLKYSKRSLIPQVYQKAFSMANLHQQRSKNTNKKQQQLNISLDKSFFPTTTLQKTEKQIQQKKQQQKQTTKVKTVPAFFNQLNNKGKQSNLLSRKKKSNTILTTSRITTLQFNNNKLLTATKPSTQRKLRNIDNKLHQLRKHNQSMIKLIPMPIQKQQKIVIKGRGEMISLQKITRVVDKLLSILELYFQMYDENGVRVMDFVKNVEGFMESGKLKEVFCRQQGGGNDMGQINQQDRSGIGINNKINSNYINTGVNMAIKHMQSNQEILQHFWAYKMQQHHQKNSKQIDNHPAIQFELPQFWGEQDYALYKLLNNFCLKLQSKYENTHKEKFKQMGEMKVERDVGGFDRLLKERVGEVGNGKNGRYGNINSSNNVNRKSHQNSTITQHLSNMHFNPHLDRKSLLQKIKYHPINSDRKISNQIQQLQDLGVKFDFRQKGRSIILAQKSEILYSNSSNVMMG